MLAMRFTGETPRKLGEQCAAGAIIRQPTIQTDLRT